MSKAKLAFSQIWLFEPISIVKYFQANLKRVVWLINLYSEDFFVLCLTRTFFLTKVNLRELKGMISELYTASLIVTLCYLHSIVLTTES